MSTWNSKKIINCACGSAIQERTYAFHKISVKHKAFMSKGETIAPPGKEVCQCGAMVVTKNKGRHELSKMHIKYMETISE